MDSKSKESTRKNGDEREREREKKMDASARNEAGSYAERCTVLDNIHQRDCHFTWNHQRDLLLVALLILLDSQ